MAAESRLRVQWYRQREHAGACNEEAAGAIDFSFLDSYCQTLYRLLRTFLRYRPFRLSTLDPRPPQEGGRFQILLATHLEDMGARSRSRSRESGNPLGKPSGIHRQPTRFPLSRE
jgi:hypothetical protein